MTAYKSVLESGLSLVIAAIIAVMLSEMVHYTIVRIQESRETDYISAFSTPEIAAILEAQTAQELSDAAVEAKEAAGEAVFKDANQSAIEYYDDAQQHNHHGHSHDDYGDDYHQLHTPIPNGKGANAGFNDAALAATILRDIELGKVEFLGTDTQRSTTAQGKIFRDINLLSPDFIKGPIASNFGTCVEPSSRDSWMYDPTGRTYCARRGCRAHHGLDIACSRTAVVKYQALNDGEITYYSAMGGYGNTVEIKQNNGWKIRYAHLPWGSAKKYGMSVGKEVLAGEIIGEMGSTGFSTGPHLHIEFFGPDGKRYDPYLYIYGDNPLPMTGGRYASNAGLLEKDPPLGWGQSDYMILLAIGAMANQFFRTATPMGSALLNAPAIAGAAGAALGGLLAIAGAALREGRGFARGLGGTELKNLVEKGIDMANQMGGPHGAALKLALSQVSRAMGDDFDERTTDPRTGEALQLGVGPARDPYAAAEQYVNPGLMGMAGLAGAAGAVQNFGSNLRSGYADFRDTMASGVQNLRNFGDSVQDGAALNAMAAAPGALRAGLADGVQGLHNVGGQVQDAMASGVDSLHELGEHTSAELRAQAEAAYKKAGDDLNAFKDFMTSEEQMNAISAGGVAMMMSGGAALGNLAKNIAGGASLAAMQGSFALASGAGNAAVGAAEMALRAAGLTAFVDEFSKASTTGRRMGV